MYLCYFFQCCTTIFIYNAYFLIDKEAPASVPVCIPQRFWIWSIISIGHHRKLRPQATFNARWHWLHSDIKKIWWLMRLSNGHGCLLRQHQIWRFFFESINILFCRFFNCFLLHMYLIFHVKSFYFLKKQDQKVFFFVFFGIKKLLSPHFLHYSMKQSRYDHNFAFIKWKRNARTKLFQKKKQRHRKQTNIL